MTVVSSAVRKRLESADWIDLSKRLYNYARRKTNALKFLHVPGELPLGHTHQDLVQDAIDRVFRGDRNWDPDNAPDLYVYLTSVIDSLLSGLLNKADYRYRAPQDLAEMAGSHEADYNDCFEALEKLVKDASADDKDLDSVRQGLEDGMPPDEIAEFFRISTMRVYTLARKLRRRIDTKMATHPCRDQWELNRN